MDGLVQQSRENRPMRPSAGPAKAARTSPAGSATDRKFEVHHARGLLAAVVSSSDDAIVSKDLNGIVTSWNPAAQRLFGYSEEEMVGASLLRIIPAELHEEEDRILTLVRSGQRIDHFETVRLRKDGQRVQVSLTVSPVRDQSGAIVGASKIARDLGRSRDEQRARAV